MWHKVAHVGPQLETVRVRLWVKRRKEEHNQRAALHLFLCFFFSLGVNFTRVSPEHLVQFVGGHAAAIIGERQTEVIRFMNYIYPELFSGHTGVWGIV